jgi:transcription-repair coupling factor (superfamily II helicase)
MGDRLYVPVHQADRLSRYVGAGEHAAPILHRLGAADWERVKKQTKKAVDDIAGDLLQLYAAREAAEGHAYSADGAWQLEMEAAFPYEETHDQLVAIEAVKHDMESSRPMDRLICGDVGYGKTEVALRSAFKAVMDGKQVAVLTPTTVLAQQHFQTFSRRLAAFPVSVEMLSRFRTPAQQAQVIDGLNKGAVDIVIGTHRLLSKDVGFKELGMLIVDEEQRFGVTHKERIKQMRQTVDVLTLTATPIPRTLHMSMTGRARSEHHRDAAGGAPADPDHHRRVRRDADPPGHPARDRPRRPGLLRPQPGTGHQPDRAAAGAADP